MTAASHGLWALSLAIILYDNPLFRHLARLLNDNDALPYNPRYNAENRLVWPYHMDVTKQGQDTTVSDGATRHLNTIV